ncbi:MAG: hypothetical protein AAGF15_05875 [Pseudomonadota bacterium]
MTGDMIFFIEMVALKGFILAFAAREWWLMEKDSRARKQAKEEAEVAARAEAEANNVVYLPEPEPEPWYRRAA